MNYSTGKRSRLKNVTGVDISRIRGNKNVGKVIKTIERCAIFFNSRHR